MSDKALAERLANLSPQQRQALLQQLKQKKAQRGGDQFQRIPMLERRAGGDVLSFAQQRLWFIDQFQSGSSAYNIAAVLQLDGALDVEALRLSFDEIVRRHEVLRSTFTSDQGQGRQHVQQHQRWELLTISLEPLSAAEQDEMISARYQGDVRACFDLTNGPLLRTRLFRLSDDRHVLILTLHHIVADGWSMGVIINELRLLYAAYCRDEQPQLTPLPLQYIDYAYWQRAWLSGDRLERQLSYWRQSLAGVPVLELATDLPRPPAPSGGGASISRQLPNELVERLRALARAHGVTLFTLLLSALKVLLMRYTGQTDLCVGTPVAGRVRPELEPLIGCFVNTLAIRSELDPEESYSRVIAREQQALSGAYDHQEMPFERLVDELNLARDMSHTPLFQVMFVLQNAGTQHTFDLPDLKAHVLPQRATTAKFDLSVSLHEGGNGIRGEWEYRTDLFVDSTIERMASHYQQLLDALVRDPECAIGRVDYLQAAERLQLIHGWNQTQQPYERDSDLITLLQAQVRAHSERPALLCFSAQPPLAVTYADLYARGLAVAQQFQQAGISPGTRVILLLPRSLDAIVAMLATVICGAVYVPLAPEQPGERLRQILDDLQVEAPDAAHAGGVHVVGIDDRAPEPLTAATPYLAWLSLISSQQAASLQASFLQDNAASIIAPQHAEAAAYVMYTSGSTGKPKGIEIIQRGILRLARSCNYLELDERTVMLQSAPLAFDAATFEIWGTLLNGGQLVIPPTGLLELDELVKYVAEGRVNTLWLTTALFHQVVEFKPELLQQLEQVITGGEVISPQLAQQALQIAPQTHFVNAYGPTENTTFSTAQPLQTVRTGAFGIPIGRPIPNTQVYVLDARQQPVPIGVVGELYVGGDGLARGYVNRPEQTATLFVPNPFAAELEAIAGFGRLYRTGDLVRYRADGALEFVGRADQQVKIRGYRIELVEIESALLRLQGVRAAAVLVREVQPQRKLLTAYVVAEAGHDLRVSEIRTELRATLPDYMVPAAFVVVAELPLTSNGKLDWRALPEPIVSAESGERVAPSTAVEHTLVEIWQAVLALPVVGIRDNFFEVGGDSILSIQIVSRARLAGLKITTRQIFENQTIEELARVAVGVEQGVDAEQGPVTGPVALTPIQHWFFSQPWAGANHFNQSVLLDWRAAEPLAADVVRQALQRLVAQHDALRAQFKLEAGSWSQTFLPACSVSLITADCYALEPKQRAEAALAYYEAAQRQLDIGAGRLLQAVLLTLAPGHQQLLLVIHHLVVDGVSWRILLEDLERLLQDPQASMAKTSSMAQWTHAQRTAVTAGEFDTEMDAWLSFAHTAPMSSGWLAAELHAEAEANPQPQPQPTRHAIHLDAGKTAQLLRQANRAYHTEINDLLLAALALALHEDLGLAELTIDLEGHGREAFGEAPDVSRTVGWFTSLFPVRLQYDSANSLATNLKSIKEQLRKIPRRGIGFQMLRYFGTESQRQALAAVPPSAVAFNYLGQTGAQAQQPGPFSLSSEARGDEWGANVIDAHRLTINCLVVNERLTLDYLFDAGITSATAVAKFAATHLQALERIIEHCCDDRHFGFTPHDFPLAALDQAQLDRLTEATPAIDSIYPLSPMQEGMLFHSLYDRESGVYFEQLNVEILGSVDRYCLRQAWQQVVDRHPVLRSAFVWEDVDRPVQIVHRHIDLAIVEQDFSRHSPRAAESALNQWLEADRQRSFDFAQPGLIRLAWLDMPAQRARLIWSFHHIVLDGWSLPLVMGEVFHCYTRLVRQQPVQLPPPGQYESFIAYLEQRDRSEAQAFWQKYLADFTVATPLPGRRSAGHEESLRAVAAFSECQRRLDVGQTERLQQFAREQHVTLNTVLQAAWGVLLARSADHDDIVFGTTVSGRPPELIHVEKIVGLFINTLPLRLRLTDTLTVGPLLSAMQAEQVDVRRFEYTPLVDIQRQAHLEGDRNLFESILVFENYPVGEALQEANELLDFGHVATVEHTNFPLTVIIEPGAELVIKLSYDTRLFAEVAVERLLSHMAVLLQGMMAQPDLPLKRLPLLTESEREQALHRWNPAPAHYPRQLALHQIFERHAVATPDHIALIAGLQQYSYRALNELSNRVARALLAQGPGSGAVIGLLLSRSAEMIILQLAALKAGFIYVALDPEAPLERNQGILADSRAVLVVATEPVMALADVVSVVTWDELQAQALNCSQENLPAYAGCTSPQRLVAHLIYTSGTTGIPKGVLVSHLGIIRLVLDTNFGTLVPSDRVTHSSSIAFDASTFEIWAPLLNGATLVVFEPRVVFDPELFLRERDRTQCTVGFLTTALFNQYLAICPEIMSRFRLLIVGGEALDPTKARKVLRQYRPEQFINAYGPTENTVFSTFHRVDQVSDGALTVPVGRSVSGATAYVLDRWLQPLPIGMPGEICVGGDGVALGYLNDDERTAQVFVADPFSAQPDARLYRTGDLGRYNEQGEIELVGRRDDQVKIRGFRIEPAEVEHALHRIEGVQHAVVTVTEDRHGQKQLVAHIVPAADTRSEFTGAQLRSLAAELLPRHMVPHAFALLTALPLTHRGKVNKAALPPVSVEPVMGSEFVAPANPREQLLAEIWQTVLQVDAVGVHDNFFDLGGDSILSIQIISRARRAGLILTARQVFEFQTVAELAAVAHAVAEEALAEQGDLTGAVPLLPAQHWFFEKLLDATTAPGWHQFNQSYLFELAPGVSQERLAIAWQAVRQQHDALRSTFTRVESDWQVHYLPGAELDVMRDGSFVTVDLSGLPASLRAEQLLSRCEQLQASLSPQAGLVARLAVFHLGDEQRPQVLLLFHHLVIDVFSWRVILEDLQLALEQARKTRTPDLGAKSTSVRQWAEVLMAHASELRLNIQTQLEWLTQLPVSAVLAALPQGENTAASRRKLEVVLSVEQTRRLLRESHHAYRTEINDLLLTAVVLGWAQWCGETKLAVDLEGHGREAVATRADLSRTVGWLTAIFPVALEAHSELAPTLKAVKERLRSLPNKGLGIAVAQAYGSLTVAPAAAISFNYLGQLDQMRAESDLLLPLPTPVGTEIAPELRRGHVLELGGSVQAERLHLFCFYSQRLQSEGEIERLLDAIGTCLNAIIDHCCDPKQFGYTPTDFPLLAASMPLSQADVDRLLPMANVETVFPATAVQAGMLYHALYSPESTVYFDQVMVTIDAEPEAPPDYSAMVDAWRTLQARHQVLRSAFAMDAERGALQRVMRRAELDIVRHDWTHLAGAAAEAAYADYILADRLQGFEFGKPGQLRISWCQLSPTDYRLVLSFHHILLDGWSMPLLFKELFELYDATLQQRTVALPPAPAYTDFIGWLQQQPHVAATQFWREYLAGLSAPTPLTIDHAEHSEAAEQAECVHVLPEQLSARLQQLARQHRLTLNQILQGAWALQLYFYSGETDVLFGSTVSGRPAELAGVERMAGLFINTIPFRAQIQPDAGWLTWLQALQETQQETRAWEFASLSEIHAASDFDGRDPLFESILVFENYPIDQTLTERSAGLNVVAIDLFQQTNFPLTLIMIPGEQLRVIASYSPRRFDAATIERALIHLEAIVSQMAADTARPINQFNWMGNRAIQLGWQQGIPEVRPYPATVSLYAQFRQVAARQSSATAWVGSASEATVTYGELAVNAELLTHALRDAGAAGSAVVVVLPRSLDLVTALLGILGARAVYVPLASDTPDARIDAVIKDCQAALVITSTSVANAINQRHERVRALTLSECVADTHQRTLAQLSWRPLAVPGGATAAALAYIIYTSGSTGLPKGVCVSQAAVSRLVINTDYVQLGPGVRIGHMANVGFDAATFEIWGALLNGGTIVALPRDDILSADRLQRHIAAQQIDCLFVTTALFNSLVSQRADVFAGLRWCLFGGEACSPAIVQRLLATPQRPEHVLHVYGPTENTVFSSWFEVTSVTAAAVTVPVGQAIANSTLLVLDSQLRPLPPMVPGEIYVGGAGVAAGYLNQPDRTAAVFIAHPVFSEERLYRTGDLGRINAAGHLEILGRLDQQVKIRGHRIELAEIEQVLQQQDGIDAAAVLVATQGDAQKRLVGCCVASHHRFDPIALKANLRQSLPSYMVPSLLLARSELPLTANGKLDRKRLLQQLQQEDLLQWREQEFAAPQTATEVALAELWQHLLGLQQVGRFDDFFDLGGHSLLITRLATAVQEQFDLELPLRTLFEVSELQAQAAIIQMLSISADVADSGSAGLNDDDVDEEEGTL